LIYTTAGIVIINNEWINDKIGPVILVEKKKDYRKITLNFDFIESFESNTF
jgi:hypothetical protein